MEHSVMILRPAVAPVSCVVVGVDGSAGAMAALDWAAAEALRCQTGLRIVSAWEEKPACAGLPPDGQPAQTAARVVQGALARVLSQQCYPRRIGCAALRGSPGCALLSRAGSTELLVLGATGDGVVQVPGATSRHCLRHGHNPLVLVPARRLRATPLPEGLAGMPGVKVGQ
jgi:nucleotide-binding universal stress UspA family protein